MVDYTYYQNVYGGDQIPAESFAAIELSATQYLHKLTFDRLVSQSIPSNVKMATCTACDVLYGLRQVANKTGVQSENNDGYSVTYRDTIKADMMRDVKSAISVHLPPSDPLRYAGVS